VSSKEDQKKQQELDKKKEDLIKKKNKIQMETIEKQSNEDLGKKIETVSLVEKPKGMSKDDSEEVNITKEVMDMNISLDD
jgi:hypothetical protein